MALLLKFMYDQLFITLPKPTISFAGKTVIVTGSNVGLGREAARHYAQQGATLLVLAVRDISKGEAAKQDILSTLKETKIDIQVWSLNLSSYASVIDFAERAVRLERIDILLENAGIATHQFELSEGNESTLTVNVLSTFLLALLLLPKLKETAQKYDVRPVLTITSSEVHGWTSFKERLTPTSSTSKTPIFDVLNGSETANMAERYPVSKLLEVLIVREWATLHTALSYPVTVNFVNPGLCHSELGREGSLSLTILKMLFARTTEEGSRTLVDATMQGPESHGCYLSNCRVEMPSELVRSEEGKVVGRRVWEEVKEILENVRPGVTGNL